MSQPDKGSLTKQRSRVSLPAIADASELSTSENKKHAAPLPTVAAPHASDLFKDLAFQKQPLRKVHSMPSEANGTGLMTIPRLQDANRASKKNDNKPKDSQKHLAKNYDNFVKDYNSLKPYARRRDGTFPSDTRCVFCQYHVPTIVFFPCQHKCVCNICLRSYDIGVDTSNPNTWTSCPVCMSDIRLMLPNDGREEDLYWHWVLEVEPMLPALFEDEFKASGQQLRQRSASVPETLAIPPPADRRERRGSATMALGKTMMMYVRKNTPQRVRRGASEQTMGVRPTANQPSTTCTLL